MKGKILLFLASLTLFFLLPQIVFAAAKSEVIFSYDHLTSSGYLNSGKLWQISNNIEDGLYAQPDGMLLKNDGDAYLVYPANFSYKDFDVLRIKFYSNRDVWVTIIPNVSTTGFNTYELRQRIEKSQQLQEIEFSLRLPFFAAPINDLGVNFYTLEPSDIVISEMSLAKSNFGQSAVRAIKDYFLVAPYSPFTVNLFPTPRIFGYSALLYFLPGLILLLWLLVKSKKWYQPAALILISVWVLIDLRMGYEFLIHNIEDYKTFVAPEQSDKVLRTYGDFYQFADWLAQELKQEARAVNYYNFGSAHFPRLLQYLVYPIKVDPDKQDSKTYVVYNRTDIFYNTDDKRIYQLDQPLSQPGEIVATYNQDSFIFQEK